MHNIAQDGLVGSDTLSLMNMGASSKLRKLNASLQRMKEIEGELEDKYIRINIPAFNLQAIQNNQLISDMKVIVGRPTSMTPRMSRTISSVTFNPAWSMPRSVSKNTMLKRIKSDPEKFAQKGITVLGKGESGEWKKVNVMNVDWDNINSKNFPFILRQPPGKRNPLGHVRFNVRNGKSIFVHGTSNPGNFRKIHRALSMGCIRVEKPLELAKFVMEGTWGVDKVEDQYEKAEKGLLGSRPSWVNLGDELAIYFVYWTAWVDQNGKVKFSKDIYNLDKELEFS